MAMATCNLTAPLITSPNDGKRYKFRENCVENSMSNDDNLTDNQMKQDGKIAIEYQSQSQMNSQKFAGLVP